MRTKVDPLRMREVNRAILLDVLRSGGRLSRSEVARRTELAKPTVSAIVEQLISEGIVEEVGLGDAMANGGRRPRLLQYDATAESYVGVKIGVNRTTVAISDGRGEILTTKIGRTTPKSPQRTITDAHRLALKAAQELRVPWSKVRRACVTMPGLVDSESGRCVLAPNLHWEDLDVRGLAEERFGVPVAVENTARAAAVAEGRLGAAVGCQSFVWVYAGTGLGSGVVIDGQLFYGHQGFAGEIGHCPVVDNGQQCGCGRFGCLETVASATAITRDANAAVARRAKTSLAKVKQPVDLSAVFAEAGRGDALSRRLLSAAGDHVGCGISYLLNLFNPERVVIGGPLTMAGDLLLDAVRASVARHTLPQVDVDILLCTVGEHVEIRGAILIAMGAPANATAEPVTA